MFELHKKHKRGRRTFMYMYIKYAWWMTLFSFSILYLTWAIYYGPLKTQTADFLALHSTWYVSTGLLSEWLILLSLSILLVAYIRARVMYGHSRFTLDEHAFHLRQGLFFVQETTIPYQQISNVHIARPYLFRIIGIAQVDVVSAADKSVERNEVRAKKFLIPVIDTSVARRLSAQLMEYSSRRRHGLDIVDTEEKEEDDVVEEELDGGEGEDSADSAEENIETEQWETKEEEKITPVKRGDFN